MLISTSERNPEQLDRAAPCLSAGSLLVGGVWVNSDPVASLAPGLKGLNSWQISQINYISAYGEGNKYLFQNHGVQSWLQEITSRQNPIVWFATFTRSTLIKDERVRVHLE